MLKEFIAFRGEIKIIKTKLKVKFRRRMGVYKLSERRTSRKTSIIQEI